MILNETVKPSFEDFIKQVKAWFVANVTDMGEETADTHVNAFTEFYQDCYNSDLSVEQTAREDMSHWEED